MGARSHPKTKHGQDVSQDKREVSLQMGCLAFTSRKVSPRLPPGKGVQGRDASRYWEEELAQENAAPASGRRSQVKTSIQGSCEYKLSHQG